MAALASQRMPFDIERRIPEGSSMVSHILLAEFDIDTGSTLRHTVPEPVEGYQDDWFAEVNA